MLSPGWIGKLFKVKYQLEIFFGHEGLPAKEECMIGVPLRIF
jgi:hypothetical protein